MKKTFKIVCNLVALLVVSAANNSHAQPLLVETVPARPDGMSIPYEKYKLPNGLTIIVHEDHSDPIVNIQVTYKVGSDRESIGKSGFAHFFEHMMFQGSSHVKDEEHFHIVSAAGGNMNGNTTRDRTVYYETLPSNQLEVALWLESDRMGFLLDSLTQKKFESQRDAVKNEKGQGDNRPYGLLSEIKDQTLYPLKHPYNWPVIGFVDDLNRASLNDVKNFFLRWYGPNNAILNVSGDVDPKEVVRLADKYFGAIKSCPEVKKMKITPPMLPADKYASFKDNIYLPLNYRVYPTVPKYHRDEAALELLASIMGDGNNSIFYKNFIKSKLALQAGVSYEGSELAGELSMYVLAYPPDDFNFQKMFNETDGKVKATIDEFEKNGITDEALQRAKAKKESQIIGEGENVESKSYMLEEWERLVGKPFNLSDDLDRFNKVTKEDLTRVLNKYIKGAGAAVVDVYPKMASKDTAKSYNPYAGMKLGDDPEYANLKYIMPVDNFDRSKHPEGTASKTPKVPEYYTHDMKNGLKVLGTMEAETPKVVIYMQIEGGDLVLKPEETKKVGISELTAQIMNEGTQNYTTEQISAELEKLGSDITFSGSKENTTITIECLKKNLDATLKLFEEKLLRPKFDAEDFKRVKKQYKEGLRDEKTNPQVLASRAYDNILFGNSPFGTFPVVKNVEKLELEDVKDYYTKYYSPSVTALTLVGDISEKDVLPKLEFLEKWAAKEVIIKPAVAALLPAEPQIFIVNKDFAPQSVISMGYTSLPFDATGDYFKNTIVNFAFGGSGFNNRINLDLREDKGYTYGIYSHFSGNQYNGKFTIGTSVKRAVTALALKEIMKDAKEYLDNGVTDEEVSFTKSSILNSEALKYETPYQKALFLNKIAKFKLDKDFTVKQAQVLKGMTKDDFNQQIKKAYKLNMAIVIVGDKDIIKDELDKVLNIKDANEPLKSVKVKNFTLD